MPFSFKWLKKKSLKSLKIWQNEKKKILQAKKKKSKKIMTRLECRDALLCGSILFFNTQDRQILIVSLFVLFCFFLSWVTIAKRIVNTRRWLI